MDEEDDFEGVLVIQDASSDDDDDELISLPDSDFDDDEWLTEEDCDDEEEEEKEDDLSVQAENDPQSEDYRERIKVEFDEDQSDDLNYDLNSNNDLKYESRGHDFKPPNDHKYEPRGQDPKNEPRGQDPKSRLRYCDLCDFSALHRNTLKKTQRTQTWY